MLFFFFLPLQQSMSKPAVKPSSGCFSSGPCAKRPGYDVAEVMKDALLGRSHRSAEAKVKLTKCITDTHRILAQAFFFSFGSDRVSCIFRCILSWEVSLWERFFFKILPKNFLFSFCLTFLFVFVSEKNLTWLFQNNSDKSYYQSENSK